jgi:hypothetical protein
MREDATGAHRCEKPTDTRVRAARLMARASQTDEFPTRVTSENTREESHALHDAAKTGIRKPGSECTFRETGAKKRGQSASSDAPIASVG